jgi:hypothetical protein
LKRAIIFTLISTLLLLNMTLVHSQTTDSTNIKSPWVYPASIANPTTCQNYTFHLDSGLNNISLIIWNNHPNWDLVQGEFVIAISSGASQVTINSINLTKDKEDLTGASTPGNFSLPHIFPCPWIEYTIPKYLADLRNPNGYQGSGDTSGIIVNLQISIIGNPDNVQIYFVSWGYKLTESGLVYTDSPLTHSTEASFAVTTSIPEFGLPAVAIMLLAFSTILFVFRYPKKTRKGVRN